MYRFLMVSLLLCAPALADSVQNVAAYLDTNSALPLLNSEDVDLATNILDAQAATGLNSLLLSEQAVVRAIGIEASIFGLTECDPSNCAVAWSQSLVAIDPGAGVTFNPPGLNFPPTIVTPEPATGLLVLSVIAARILGKRRRRNRIHPGLAMHHKTCIYL